MRGLDTFTGMNNPFNQLIIGSGFAGLCAAIKLKEQGENNFVILERNDRLGGTWYDNHYPGAACDVESHLYSYSFEPNANWSRQFGPQQEILQYMEHCADKYDVKKHIEFGAAVVSAVFDEAGCIWTVETAPGKKYEARVLISCPGGLSQPSLPDIKGIDSFTGKKFHSAQWDNHYDLKGKTVAVIGTGASAIQIVPAIAPWVKQLNLYQRTAPWILPKPDKEISALRRWMYNYVPFAQALHRTRLYWTHELMAFAFVKSPGLLKLFSRLALRYINKTVKSEALRKKLTPNYVMGCKRVLLSNEYYQALQLPNVDVITDSIQQITETGVITTDGKLRAVDAIVLATGFQAAEEINRFTVRGKNGMDLNECWRNGAEAYLGTFVSGFPNMFLVVGPNTGLGHSSMILMIEAQVRLIMETLAAMKKKNARMVDVKKTVQTAFNEDIQTKLAKTVWQRGGCHSWYQTQSGKNVTLWPGFTFTFMKRTEKFEAEKFELV